VRSFLSRSETVASVSVACGFNRTGLQKIANATSGVREQGVAVWIVLLLRGDSFFLSGKTERPNLGGLLSI
jgi:hypothetical protein